MGTKNLFLIGALGVLTLTVASWARTVPASESAIQAVDPPARYLSQMAKDPKLGGVPDGWILLKDPTNVSMAWEGWIGVTSFPSYRWRINPGKSHGDYIAVDTLDEPTGQVLLQRTFIPKSRFVLMSLNTGQ